MAVLLTSRNIRA